MGGMPVFLAPILLMLLCAYLVALCPNRGRQGRMRPFEEVYIAHRGLHDNAAPWPENSLQAFRRAAEVGFGIELDVQLTADDVLVVFHDETLARACSDDRKLHETTFAELQKLRLFGTEEHIPTLSSVLALVDGRVPIIVEIKSEGRWQETTRRTAELLDSYDGLYCVESFHPMVVRWFRENRPRVLRGQLATNFFREPNQLNVPTRFLLTNLLLDYLAKPDFIAYDRRYAKGLSFRLCRALFQPTCAAWTVKSQTQLDEARDSFSVYIFDSFFPDGGPFTGKEETS